MSNEWHDADEHVDKAHECFEAGRWSEAERLLRKALAAHPDRAEWHFNLGMTLEAAEKWAEAAKAFADAARHSPNRDATPWVASAVNHLRADDPASAVEPLANARKLDPNRLDAFVHSIEALARTGHTEEAEVMFYQALQLEGDHADAYANMGEALIDRREFERAAACFREALKLQSAPPDAASPDREARQNPPSPRVAARLAFCLQRLNRPDEARQWYLRELRENPGDIDTLLDLGDLLAESNREAEAGEKFRRVLELRPGHADALFALGTLAARQHRLTVAAKRFNRVLRAAPEHPEARLRLARIRLMQGKPEAAQKHLKRELFRLRRASQDGPPRSKAHSPPPSANSASSAVNPLPDSAPDHLRELGVLLLDANMPREAASVFTKLARATPEDAQAHHHLAVACLQCGMVRPGLRAERRALRLDPTIIEAWHNLSLAYLRAKQWTKASACLKRAQALAPSDPNIRRLALKHRIDRLRHIFGRVWPF
jgi:tetratricopeptide (TPR) repeat protein